MAGPQHDTTEFEPRRRIIGAIILVTLAFVALSMVLQDKPGVEDKDASAPAPDTRIVVAPVPERSPPPTMDAAGSTAHPVTPKTPTATPAAKPPVVAESKPAPAVNKVSPTHKTSSPAAGAGDWMVQVGTFSESANARRLGEKLKARHFPVHLNVVSLDKGRAVRVQAGPFASKAKAIAARNDIEKHLGVHGVVFARK